MVEPRVVPRPEHTLSRRDVDPDALRVLYRLKDSEHTAYLVGGSVRDLLLGHRPKDFDIGTSAHPSQVKKLFRNCWIIGRRFRLAHVKFGNKVVEVATFRRQIQPGEEIVQDGVPAPDPSTTEGAQLVHHDNTFGTPEEDAFRRDFTINALFYDIATFSIIDYVNGLEDLRARVVRSIGDPVVRFQEDPVRMLRAVALAARLDFDIDRPVLDAIRTHRHEIARSSPARLLEEYYKILRGGNAEKIFRSLHTTGLLEPIAPELHAKAGEQLWRSLADLDTYRRGHASPPDAFTNSVLLGSLILPLGMTPQPHRREDKQPPLKLGLLQLPRRDVERLHYIVSMQRRLRDLGANPRVKQNLLHRGGFGEALAWMEIHGQAPEIVEHWRGLAAGSAAPESDGDQNQPPAATRRRRRRRRRPRPAPHS